MRSLLMATALVLVCSCDVQAQQQSDTEVREVWDIFQQGVSACYEDGQDRPGVSYPWSPEFAKRSTWMVMSWFYSYDNEGNVRKNGTPRMTTESWHEWYRAIMRNNSKHLYDAPCVLNWMRRHLGEYRA